MFRYNVKMLLGGMFLFDGEQIKNEFTSVKTIPYDELRKIHDIKCYIDDIIKNVT